VEEHEVGDLPLDRGEAAPQGVDLLEHQEVGRVVVERLEEQLRVVPLSEHLLEGHQGAVRNGVGQLEDLVAAVHEAVLLWCHLR